MQIETEKWYFMKTIHGDCDCQGLGLKIDKKKIQVGFGELRCSVRPTAGFCAAQQAAVYSQLQGSQ